jgi:general secretion pathway protein H
MKTSSARSNSRAGFSLTELLIALVILAIAVTLVAPMLFANSPERDLRQADRVFESAARIAQTEARLTGQDTLLTVDLDARTLTVFPSERAFRIDREIDVRATVAEAELEDRLASVRFFPEGATTGGTFLMTLEDSARALRISWLSGQVERLNPDELD